MGYCDVCQSAGSVNRYGFCEVCGTNHEAEDDLVVGPVTAEFRSAHTVAAG